MPDFSSVHVNNLKAVLSEPSERGTTARTKGELIFNVNLDRIDIRLSGNQDYFRMCPTSPTILFHFSMN